MTTAAFFDMDETLIGVNSARLWVEHLWREGELRKRDLVRSLGWLMGYRLAIVDIRRVAEQATSTLRGQAEAEMMERVERWYEEHVREHILPEMVKVVDDHRREGHRVVLLTAGSPYIAGPLCRDVGIDDYLCTRFEVVEGRFTGRLVAPMCYAEGKVALSESFADTHGIDLGASYFYTDSFTDLPMLERVGNPVVVNPDPRLARWAREHRIDVRLHRR